MSCLDVKRILLAAPRERSARDVAHISTCAACAPLAAAAADLDRALEQAVLVSVPDSLADRVLLRRDWRQRRRTRLVAVTAAAMVLAVISALQFRQAPPELQAVGARHPAVAAISEVVREHERAAAVGPGLDADDDLRRLGLSLPRAEGRAEYLGDCHVAGSRECEHIVVTTARDRANVLLVPDLPRVQRLLVADQRMVALMNAARTGGFIVVAHSAESATRVEKLLLREPVEPQTYIDPTEAP
jgi:hypothetical protein